MSDVSRRKFLTVGTAIGAAALMDGKLSRTAASAAQGLCPYCGANAALGDLHAPGCQYVKPAKLPADTEIDSGSVKTALADQQQDREFEQCNRSSSSGSCNKRSTSGSSGSSSSGNDSSSCGNRCKSRSYGERCSKRT